MRREESLNAGRIERVTITLDWEMIAWFKAQTGEGGGDTVAGAGLAGPPVPGSTSGNGSKFALESHRR